MEEILASIAGPYGVAGVCIYGWGVARGVVIMESFDLAGDFKELGPLTKGVDRRSYVNWWYRRTEVLRLAFCHRLDFRPGRFL